MQYSAFYSAHRCLCGWRENIEVSVGLVKTGSLKRNLHGLIFFIKHQRRVARNLHADWIQTCWWVTAGTLARSLAVFLDGVFSITECSKGTIHLVLCFFSQWEKKIKQIFTWFLPKSSFSIMNQGYYLSTVSRNILLCSVPKTFSSLEFLTYPNMPFLFIIKAEIGCFSGNPWLGAAAF